MHLCQGVVEEVKLNHSRHKICKQDEKPSCCATKPVQKHCEDSENISLENQDKDCCNEQALADDIQDQQTVKVFEISPIIFNVQQISLDFTSLLIDYSSHKLSNLDFYVASNAPPIYILNRQLVLYEA